MPFFQVKILKKKTANRPLEIENVFIEIGYKKKNHMGSPAKPAESGGFPRRAHVPQKGGRQGFDVRGWKLVRAVPAGRPGGRPFARTPHIGKAFSNRPRLGGGGGQPFGRVPGPGRGRDGSPRGFWGERLGARPPLLGVVGASLPGDLKITGSWSPGTWGDPDGKTRFAVKGEEEGFSRLLAWWGFGYPEPPGQLLDPVPVLLGDVEGFGKRPRGFALAPPWPFPGVGGQKRV